MGEFQLTTSKVKFHGTKVCVDDGITELLLILYYKPEADI